MSNTVWQHCSAAVPKYDSMAVEQYGCAAVIHTVPADLVQKPCTTIVILTSNGVQITTVTNWRSQPVGNEGQGHSMFVKDPPLPSREE